MHELSVCLSLLREVERVSHGRPVAEIVIAVGPLSGVEPQQLERAFAVARDGTVAGSARLVCRAKPVRFACSACGHEVDVAPDTLVCPACGDWKVRLCCGDELMLESVTLDDPSRPLAHHAELRALQSLKYARGAPQGDESKKERM